MPRRREGVTAVVETAIVLALLVVFAGLTVVGLRANAKQVKKDMAEMRRQRAK